MFEGLTPTHLILVLAIALIVFGPGKLPEVGAALGRTIREFRSAAQGENHAIPVATTEPVPTRDSSEAHHEASTSSG